MFNHTKIDMLKIDVDDSEWGLLNQIIHDDLTKSAQIGSLILKLHYKDKNLKTKFDILKRIEIVKQFYAKGFKIFSYSEKPGLKMIWKDTIIGSVFEINLIDGNVLN